ncbi:unnamed protein product [Paramecium sonneborni]|uniref:Uncharacterized protein n=1 Tax=Paramecium sonneborni TaxID=65129 RepID=A0A8S1QXD0_9CILI|nr:unnamed protein product [Paramecium sonneborni]
MCRLKPSFALLDFIHHSIYNFNIINDRFKNLVLFTIHSFIYQNQFKTKKQKVRRRM